MASIYDKSSLVLIPSGTKTSKVYSQKPTNGDGDFDFTRSTAATRVNADGNIEKERANYMFYSQQFENGFWNKYNLSVTPDQATAPNGTLTADLIDDGTGTGNHNIEEKNLTGGKVVTASIHAKYINTQYLAFAIYDSGYRVVIFDIQNGTIGNQSTSSLIPSIENVGGGWYRCIVTYPDNSRFDPFVSFSLRDDDVAAIFNGTGANRQAYIWGVQLENGLVANDYIETTTTTAVYGGITDNVPRLDYTDSSCPALLLEPQRTNILPQSEFYGSGSGWQVLSNSSVTSNAVTSPEGNQNASYLTFTNSGSSTQFYRIVQTTGSKQVLSVFVKYVSGSGSGLRLSKSSDINYGINLEFSNNGATLTGTAGTNVDSYKIEDYGNQWFRVSVVINLSSSALEYNLFRHSGTGTDVYAIWGLQVEGNASYPTSYIPTYGTSVTRNGDACNSAGDANTFNDSEGVLYAEIDALSNDLNIEAISISDGTGNNRVVIFKWNTSNAIRARITSGGYSVNLDFQVSDITSINKIAVKYKTNDFALWINGVEVRTNTNGSNPSGLNQLSFNSDGGSGAHFYGNTKQILYFPTALSDTELATLTTI